MSSQIISLERMRIKSSLSVQWPFNTYLYTNGLYQLQDTGWEASESESFTLKNWKSTVCIVAREHYIEEQRDYPISNIYHLLKIIQAEKQNIAPFDGETFWAITKFTPGQFQVTYWSVQSHIIESLRSQFKFIVPESFLLVQALSEDGVFTIGKDRGLFLYKQENSFVCMIKDALIDSADRFCALLNKPELASNIQSISDEQYQSILAQRVKKLPPYYFIGLHLSNVKEKASYDIEKWKKPALFGLCGLFAYGIAVTSYLNNHQANLDSLLGEKRKEMSVLLKTESQLRSLQATQDAYQFISHEFPSLSNLFAMLVPLKEKGLVIQNIRLTGSEVKLRVVSPSGTDVFSTLAESKLVSNLDFDGAIQKHRGTDLDVYTLQFNYVRGSDNE